MPTTIANRWKKYIGKDDATVDETRLQNSSRAES
jgi:hypothetical protein